MTAPEVVATGVLTSFEPDATWFRVALDRPSDASDDVLVSPGLVPRRLLTGTKALVPGQRVECVRTERSRLWGRSNTQWISGGWQSSRQLLIRNRHTHINSRRMILAAQRMDCALVDARWSRTLAPRGTGRTGLRAGRLAPPGSCTASTRPTRGKPPLMPVGAVSRVVPPSRKWLSRLDVRWSLEQRHPNVIERLFERCKKRARRKSGT